MLTSPSLLRPTIGLAMIIKNERKNLPRLFQSVSGCFDEIHITDTGSDDGSVDWLMSPEAQELAKCPVHVHYFEWCDDFAKARNFAFQHGTSDYIMWMDGDDVLNGKDFFIKWRDTTMCFADFFFNTYNYALDDKGKPLVSFVRERVVKRALNPVWNYALHEGIHIERTWRADYALSWTVDHVRDAEDVKQDRSRNIRIIEKMKREGKLDARMQFYLAKEYFENANPHAAISEFDRALEMPLEPHDKTLSYQYASYACQQIGDTIKDELKDEKHSWYLKAMGYALDGAKFDATRAEYWVSAADSQLKMGNRFAALPMYAAAKHCITSATSGQKMATPVYQFKECYGQMPLLQMAKIYLSLHMIDDGEVLAKECVAKYNNEEAKGLLDQIKNLKPLISLENKQEQTEDIVFSCPPGGAYPFDEVLYEEKGMGGSETALIEMARWLKKKTGRRVIVFNTRSEDLVAPSGVEYISNAKLNEYMAKNLPRIHIAWRHNIKLTNAKTYLWCHDLFTPNVENVMNFDKIMCLTEFHKNYIMGKQGVPEEKTYVTRNGLNPEKFAFKRPEKNPNKLVWLSSPDRGLKRCMLVLDRVREKYPNIELHVYYGTDNLEKYGLKALADELHSMMSERSWVKYHGFTEQKKMAREIADAVIWPHTHNFIESFCITALETMELGIYPVTRALGALVNVLDEPSKKGMATLLQFKSATMDHHLITEEEIEGYQKAIEQALETKAWEKISFNVNRHSWEAVSNEWLSEFGLVQPIEPRVVE